MDMVSEVYGLTKYLPRHEAFGISSQLRRAAVSVPSNIAEGQKRKGSAEFRQFLRIAMGSLGELETQLLLVHRLYGLSSNHLFELVAEIQRMLTKLEAQLKTRN
jgi:four helix bundle protein